MATYWILELEVWKSIGQIDSINVRKFFTYSINMKCGYFVRKSNTTQWNQIPEFEQIEVLVAAGLKFMQER